MGRKPGSDALNGAARHRPLSIVLVAPPYFDVPPAGYGGVEAVVAELADTLVARGHQVTLLGAGKPGTAAEFIPVWDRIQADRLGDPFPEVVNALKVRRIIEELARSRPIDIIHDHTFAGPLNAPAYEALGIPTAVTVHGPGKRGVRARRVSVRVVFGPSGARLRPPSRTAWAACLRAPRAVRPAAR
ncbi:glycosyltransferase [Nocardia cyriacigeorgica]|uniref:glycosyltransferase n=1 Tax=Nocardia cyriacigeorgica TaxID=135487 RepID=UPI002453BF77|nr:glycosyltransferase [Nocardia cyriacigeorgica]